ncbi:MAG: integrase domain-containing protein [Candidatus Thiodiazotropha lotti]|nr:integrase domain-containing protein [Candidatus Thiodiazotropha lotti]
MRELNYQLKQLCRRNRDGSYRTQTDRERQLTLVANQLHTLGYRKMNAQSLKPKHVEALVQHWQKEDISVGAIKNRLTVIRWWAQKVNRQNVVARSNDHYGIPDRQFVTNISKAQSVTMKDLDRVRDLHVRMSLELQQAFGLRREEAIKFQPSFADQGDHITLKASWTKGGKPREIPVRTEAQRLVLSRAQQLAGNGSLIPSSRNYRQQLRIYERHTANAGLSKMHGLRHAYAQQRYQELTGWPAPAAGGSTVKALTPDQKLADKKARLTISVELGHERIQVVGIYLGNWQAT